MTEDPFLSIDRAESVPGAIGVLTRQSKMPEIAALEKESKKRIWRVRGIVSDHIPLAGNATDVLTRKSEHRFFLNETPLTIYVQKGGSNAVFYDLVAHEEGKLEYIEVWVETDLPSNALLLARQPLNELLDAIVTNYPLPLVFQRLELLSPANGDVLLYELILPFLEGLKMGPLGGLWLRTPFATFDAIFREAITSTSPFYQFLCACRAYEGTASIRKWLKDQRSRFNIPDKMPGDPSVEASDLVKMGLPHDLVKNVRKASDVFEVFREHRNGVAHYLVEGKFGSFHINLSDGGAIREFSLAAAVLLKYARIAINDLRQYYVKHFETKLMRGTVLPMKEHRDRFVVREPQAKSQQKNQLP